MLQRTKNILRNNGGSAAPLVLALFLFVMALVAALGQMLTIYYTCNHVKAAMQQAALTAVTANSEETYASKREGYSGAWMKSGTWQEATDVVDARSLLAELLGAEESGDDLIKRDADGRVQYTISHIRLTVDNPVFADKTTDLSSSLVIDIALPVRYPFGYSTVLPLTLHTAAVNRNKY